MQSPNQFQQTPEKGQIALQKADGIISCQVGSAAPAALLPGDAVTLVDEVSDVPTVVKATNANQAIFGFVAYNVKDAEYAAGARVEIAALPGCVMYMQSSAAVAKGAPLMIVVSGSKVVAATATNRVIGYAFDKATAADQLIRVVIGPVTVLAS